MEIMPFLSSFAIKTQIKLLEHKKGSGISRPPKRETRTMINMLYGAAHPAAPLDRVGQTGRKSHPRAR